MDKISYRRQAIVPLSIEIWDHVCGEPRRRGQSSHCDANRSSQFSCPVQAQGPPNMFAKRCSSRAAQLEARAEALRGRFRDEPRGGEQAAREILEWSAAKSSPRERQHLGAAAICTWANTTNACVPLAALWSANWIPLCVSNDVIVGEAQRWGRPTPFCCDFHRHMRWPTPALGFSTRCCCISNIITVGRPQRCGKLSMFCHGQSSLGCLLG